MKRLRLIYVDILERFVKMDKKTIKIYKLLPNIDIFKHNFLLDMQTSTQCSEMFIIKA